MPRGREIFAERVANETVVGQDSTQVVVTFEHNAKQVEGFALEPAHRAPNAGQGVNHWNIVIGGEHFEAHALVQADRQQMGHDGITAAASHAALAQVATH